ncbi:MAG: hypothetical protein ACREOL_02400 [Candidatus Dormibacteria bacterium]
MHQRLALALILVGLVAAAWCFIDLRRRGAPSGGVRAFIVLCFALVVVQDAIGLVLLAQGHRPHNVPLHIMYGALSAAVLPVAWGMSARSPGRSEALFLGFGSLLFAGLTLRATLVA